MNYLPFNYASLITANDALNIIKNMRPRFDVSRAKIICTQVQESIYLNNSSERELAEICGLIGASGHFAEPIETSLICNFGLYKAPTAFSRNVTPLSDLVAPQGKHYHIVNMHSNMPISGFRFKHYVEAVKAMFSFQQQGFTSDDRRILLF